MICPDCGKQHGGIDAYRWRCPKCKEKHTAKRMPLVKAKMKATRKAWAVANPDKIRDHSWKQTLRRKYGITTEDYYILLAKQGNKCAICRANSSGRKYGRMIVDHCHTSNQVRGLLCFSCNILIGHSKDNVSILQSAINYLNS